MLRIHKTTFTRQCRWVPAALATTALVAGCAAVPPETGETREPQAGVSVADQQQQMPVIRTEHVYSEYRQTEVQLYVAYPTGVSDLQNLPMVLYLHGRDGVDPTPIPYDTLQALETEYHNGTIPAFGFVVVDGGYNPWWHDASANGQLSSMLHEELPRWLQERGLGDENGLPFAVAGISTGGFGALNYAADRNLAGNPVSVAAELAPALPVTWEHMQEKNVFADEQEWAQYDPLRRLEDLGDTPVGVWIGDADPYLPGSQQLVADYPNTPVVSVLPGGHEAAVFEAVGSEMVQFLAQGIDQVS